MKKTIAIFNCRFVAPLLITMLFTFPALASTPKDLVSKLHTVLIESMKKADTTSQAERYQHLAPILKQIFDFNIMVKTAAGAAWHTAQKHSQIALQHAFARLSTATYVSRFKGYNGHKFDIQEVEDGPRGTVLVHAELASPTMNSVPLTYVVIKRKEKLRIVDIILEHGISELAVKRSEYSTIVSEGGATALTKALTTKANSLISP